MSWSVRAPEVAAGADDWTSYARRWTIVLLLVGVAWRLIRYGLDFPVWGDEASLMMNVVDRHTYAELLRPLENDQVAPYGFLVAQFTAVQQLGTSEYALRLFPLITGLAALFLFARLAWLAQPPLAAAYALGVLAATHYVTRYSLDIKPYGTDLMVAAGLLTLALSWRRRPDQRRWLAMLTVTAPLAMVLSYPAIFVAGAIGLWALTIMMDRRSETRDWRDWALVVAFNVAALISFAGVLYLWAAGQHHHLSEEVMRYWAPGMPPANPVGFVAWLIDVHTAEMMSYPLGGAHGASTATFILCLVGIGALVRRGDRSLLLLLGLLFGLTFLAAALRRYPYGGSARVAQHLAPGICLFVGAAIERIVRAFRTADRNRAAVAASVGLLSIALGGTVRDVLHPYHTVNHQRIRTVLRGWQQNRTAHDGMWLANGFAELPPSIQWYLLRGVDFERARLYEGSLEPVTLAAHDDWWVLDLELERDEKASREAQAQLAAAGFTRTQTTQVSLSKFGSDLPHQVLELQRWHPRR